MADRFWVGGGSAASWLATGPTNWSTTSGGANDASLPTSADLAIFDANSGTGNIQLTNGWGCGGLSISSLSGAMAFTGGGVGTITGGMQLPATNFSWSATGGITFDGSGTNTINTNGVTINGNVTINGTGSWTLQSALTLGSNDNFIVTAGSLDTAGYAVSCQLFNSSATATRSVTLGASVITVTGSGTAWNFSTVTNLTFSGASAQIIATRSTGTGTFAGGGLSYGRVTKDGAGTLVISGNNTIGTLDNTTGSGPVTFTAGTTQTITTWDLNGTSGTPLVIGSSVGGTAFTIYKASGAVVADYVTLSDCTGDISGGATYTATNSTDGGGNTNWSFGGPVTKQIAGTGGGSAPDGTAGITGGTGGPSTKQIAGTGGGSAPDGTADITGGTVVAAGGGFFVINRRRRRA